MSLFVLLCISSIPGGNGEKLSLGYARLQVCGDGITLVVLFGSSLIEPSCYASFVPANPASIIHLRDETMLLPVSSAYPP